MVEAAFDSYAAEMMAPMPSQCYGDRVLGHYRKQFSDGTGSARTAYSSGRSLQCKYYKNVDREKTIRRSIKQDASTGAGYSYVFRALMSLEAVEQLAATYRIVRFRELLAEPNLTDVKLMAKLKKAIAVVGNEAAMQIELNRPAYMEELTHELRSELAETDHFKRSKAYFADLCAKFD